MMKTLLFITIFLLSCSQQDSTKNQGEKIAEKDEAQLALDSKPEDNLYLSSEEADTLADHLEMYNESGDPIHLQGFLDFYSRGLNDEYSSTYSHLYCGLVHELMGNKTKAHYYYKRANQLASEEMSKPLDFAAFGATSEKELVKLYKQNSMDINIEALKANDRMMKKYWLYLTEIALGEDKFKEYNSLNMSEIGFPMSRLLHIEMKSRNDIFNLITWEVYED